VDLAGRVQVVETKEEFADDDGNVRLAERSRFELQPLVWSRMVGGRFAYQIQA
jgi:hypothetical protein